MLHITNEQVNLRIDKKKQLEDFKIAPYPSKNVDVNATTEKIKKNYQKTENNYQDIVIAGRLLTKRIMGAASFATLQDQEGNIQLYIARDELCKTEDKFLYNTLFKRLIDIGDIIEVKGFAFTTKLGEVTIHVTKLQLLTKALHPLPIVKEKHLDSGEKQVYDAFTDPEQRYRKRYLDLIVNPQVRNTFIKRSQLIQSIRDYLNQLSYLEVETPILQPIYGGALARPFTTHHHTLDTKLYLRIANELYLKRLIVGGYHGVYEFAKDFRNEGMSRFHNPEFTMLELYVAYKDYLWMMKTTEEMIEQAVVHLYEKSTITVGEHQINFKKPWKRIKILDLIQQETGYDLKDKSEAELKEIAKKLSVEINPDQGKGKIIDKIFAEKCEGKIIQPTFVTDYPIEMSPLAKQRTDDPKMVERFEVICNGMEIANAYSELNDPLEQKKRFEEQVRLNAQGDDEAMMIDEDFIEALAYGMPPTAGLGIGIDRLSMIMNNTLSIQDVIFFPQMKPKSREEKSLKDR